MSIPLRLDPRGLCAAEESALIGVSGGRDSVALLHALLARGFQRLTVCHYDHGWRTESGEEARFVEALAARAGLPFVLEKAEPPAAGENAARQARLRFFARTAAELGWPRFFLAHHADDQAETVLHHLLRGAGASGLAGMASLAWHEWEGEPLCLLRPLLGTWRPEIDAYVVAHGLEYREDASNADPRHTRNRLRHQLIPDLERTLGRPVRQALWRTAEILAAEDAHLAAAPELQAAASPELQVKAMRALPLALQRRLFHAWLQHHRIPHHDFADVENLRSLLDLNGPAKVNLPGDRHARRRAGVIFLEGPNAESPTSAE